MEGIKDEEITKWDEEIRNGKTINQISKETGRAWNTIVCALRDKRKFRRLTKKEREKIKDLYRSGMSESEIIKLKKFNKFSIGTIWYVIKKVSHNKKRKKINDYKKILSNLSESHLGYIAGIIDGEGSIIIAKDKGGRFRFILQITNCDKKIIKYIKPLILYDTGKNNKNVNIIIKKEENRSIVYEVRTTDKKILKILYPKILPYIIGKKEEIKLCLEAIKNKNKCEDNFLLLKKIKHKKHKGVIIC